MADASDQLLEAMTLLDDVSRALTPEEAVEELDAATLQSFWREWPHAVGWAGELWRRLNVDLETPAAPLGDAGDDEVGGSG
ncbi:MAG: hypothetical protein ACE5GB_01985 [Acidimicrobiales bacterium]